MPSQWALQYFCLSGAMQLQAEFAHFFVPAICASFVWIDPGSRPGDRRLRCWFGRKGCRDVGEGGSRSR
jgi:hypothetical protein